MEPGKVLNSIGSGITTFFIITVFFIELLNFEFSAIIALPIGIVTGIATLAILTLTYDDIPQPGQLLLAGYAAFGILLLLLLAARYVNIGRSVLTVPRIIGLSVTGAILTLITTWLTT